MRHIILVLFSFFLVTSCNNGNSKSQRVLSKSSGNLNNVSVVMGNEMWKGRVGDAVREVLAAPVDGLPQDEPLFNMNQIPTSVFSGFVKKNRTVLKIEKSEEPAIKIARDVFARPQMVVVISGKNKTEIINTIKSNSAKIISAFKSEELKEKQRRIKLSLHKNNTLKEKLGISIQFPTAYRVAEEDDKFFWLRKDIDTGTTNLMLYELPLDALKQNDSTINNIIKIRDSISKIHIPGPTEGSYMITENAYSPFLFETIIDNKPALEARGIWKVENAFMSGPFIACFIEDKINNRLVVVEGFAFAPSVNKREYMFELEAIIKSIKL